MVLSRTQFFLAFILLLITPLLTYKVIWLLRAKKTTGVFVVESYGPALDQIRFPYSIIYFIAGKDSVFFKGPPKLGLPEKASVPVLYQPGNPTDARLDSFGGIWTGTIIYGGIPLLFLLVILLHPHIVPYKSSIMLTKSKPFIRVVKRI